MLPEWMKERDDYTPPVKGGIFAVKTIAKIGNAVGKIKFQQGKDRKYDLPPLLKFIIIIIIIIILSLTQSTLLITAVTALILLWLATYPAEMILSVLKTSLIALTVAFVFFIPSIIMRPPALSNNLRIVYKIFLTVMMLGIFNRSSQWNTITASLKKAHIPTIFIFTLDISLKYIVVLGRFINGILTAYILRSVGENKKNFTSTENNENESEKEDFANSVWQVLHAH